MVNKLTKWIILKLFLNDYSRRYYLREMAVALNKPHQTIKPYIERLVEEDIISKDEKKGVVEYKLNFKNKRLYDYIVIAEKQRLIEILNKNIVINMLFERLSYFFSKNTFIIFGSAAADLTKFSDIDLLVIGKENISKTLDEFKEVYNKRVHKIQINNINKITAELLIEIYKKHIIFNNTEMIIRYFGELYEKHKLV